jgi:hypothetical protein
VGTTDATVVGTTGATVVGTTGVTVVGMTGVTVVGMTGTAVNAVDLTVGTPAAVATLAALASTVCTALSIFWCRAAVLLLTVTVACVEVSLPEKVKRDLQQQQQEARHIGNCSQ